MKRIAELREYIDTLVILDTHEHCPGREELRPAGADVLAEWLTHYFSCDLVSAGLSNEALDLARDASRPLPERWRAVEPYWEAARNTGYGRSLDLAARGIYGVDGVRGKTLGALNEAFVAARAAGGHYRRVLKDLCRIERSILDTSAWDGGAVPDKTFFVEVARFDHFVHAQMSVASLQTIGRTEGLAVHTLADLKLAMERRLDRALARGIVALKTGLAYVRSLHFERASAADAERDLNRIFAESRLAAQPSGGPGSVPGLAFQNHMFHHLLSLASARKLVFQVHTGLQEGNGNVIRHADPSLMSNLFLCYPDVRFDLFHMGYPYCLELSALAKNFRNVFIDMCWGHIISPEAARQALAEWLDAVPASKISAFGGDYCFVDGIYGHQELARQNVAAVLARKVDDGSFGMERAREIARMLFVDNPRNLFSLKTGTA